MKKYNKYIGLLFLSLAFFSCDDKELYPEIVGETVENVELNANGLEFSKYVSVGASFTAGFTDNALFKAAQKNSFPNILAGKFAMAGGGDFNQPLMNDNIGGLLFAGNVIQGPRLYFNGAGPVPLAATPTTEVTNPVTGSLNNFGIPGAKSFHFLEAGYGNAQGVPVRLANPYFVRFASSASTTALADAVAAAPTFFTLSEIGGNDVLGFATNGGYNPKIEATPFTPEVPASNAIYQSDSMVDPLTYGANDITNTGVFAEKFNEMLTKLTESGAKGIVANVPYITSLAHFTTVPYNPVPLDAATAGVLNGAYAQYNGGIQQAFAYLVGVGAMDQATADAEIAKRTITFAEGQNAVVIMDESLTNLTTINAGLVSMRQATAEDLLVLTSSSFIGTLADPNNPLSINGVAVPLADKWVLTPEEQEEIKDATDAYNTTIETMVGANPNVGLVDFKSILEQASTTGIIFDEYNMNTDLVFGGLVSLDGVHLTARGYAMMANEILKATDAEFGSNFSLATDGLAKANDYPTNYSPTLQ